MLGRNLRITIPEPEHRSEDDWVQLGKDQELDGNLLAALQTYQDALAKFSESFELRKAAGRLCASLLRFHEAKPLLESVHARDTLGPGDFLLSGHCVRRSGPEPAGTRIFRSCCAVFRPSAPHPNCGWRAFGARRKFKAERSFTCNLLPMRGPNDLRTAEELAAILGAEGRKKNRGSLPRNGWRDFLKAIFCSSRSTKRTCIILPTTLIVY